MNIRDYNENDKDAVQTIFTKYWTDEEFLNELAKNIHEGSMHFYVAEKDGEVFGVVGFRESPEYLRAYAETKSPAELYVVASKVQDKGIGSALVRKVIEEARNLSFTEIECYSPETHDSSWKFYEKLTFTRHGIIKDPDDGYSGMLWRKIIL